MNWYVYCDANPLVRIDPCGLVTLVVGGDAAAAVGFSG